jgi:hypothetical protein
MENISGTRGAGQPGVVRDDRIFPEIKPIAAFIVAVLIAAVAILYLVPDRTKDFFAWEIKPTMTPMLMGAGYLSGAWFFIRAIMSKQWHHFGNGFLAITTFTWFMGIATLLHLDKFTPGHISFYAWFILYVVTPFLVPFLWWRNRVTDPGTPDPDDVVVPPMVRQFALITGVVLLAIALLVFIFADFVATKSAAAPNGMNIWPWNTSPLTARVIGGWFALPGVVGLIVSREPRWSAWRILIESQLIALVLILVAAARAWGEFHQDNPLTWVFILGIAGLLTGAGALYFTMEARRRAATSRAVAA